MCASNSDCGVGGQCVRGACLCANGLEGPNCANAVKNQNLGSVVITQAALSAYPQVYSNFIQNTFTQVEAAAVAATSYGPYCNYSGSSDDYYVQVNQLNQNQVTASLDQSSIVLTIVPGGFSFSASATASITNIKMDLLVGSTSIGSSCVPSNQPSPIKQNDLCLTTNPNSLGEFCFWYCDRTTNDYVNMAFTGTVQGTVLFVYNSTINGLSAAVQGVTVNMSPSNLNFDPHCTAHTHDSFIQPYLDAGVQLGAQELAYTAAPVVAQKITTLIQQEALLYQGWQSYNSGNGTSLRYIVTSATINTPGPSGSSSNNIVIGLQGQVVSTIFFSDPASCWVNVTYFDPQPDANLLPPTNWSGPINSLTLASNYPGPLIAGARMTRSFLNALIWSQFWQQNLHGYSYSYQYNSLVLSGTATWSSPNVSIPSTNDRVTLSVSGTISAGCAPTVSGNVLSFNYANIAGAFTVAFVDSPSMIVTFQVLPGYFTVGSVSNVLAPHNSVINGNTTLVAAALQEGLNLDVSQLNSFFLENGNAAFSLPTQFQGVFPDGSVAIVSYTTGGVVGESGYFELTGRCSCDPHVASDTVNVQTGVETVVQCPQALLQNTNFCPLTGRRRADDHDDSKPKPPVRRAVTTDTTAFTTLIGELYTTCVTRSPSRSPTPPTRRPTAAPIRSPTTAPLFSPTPPSIKNVRSNCIVNSTNQCYWQYNTLVFQCNNTAFVENVACRVGNSDILCCPARTSGGASASSVSMALTLVLVACIGVGRATLET